MRTAPATDLRRNLDRLLDGVADDQTPLIVTRRNKAEAALVPRETYGLVTGHAFAAET